jgi:hypothetical protein
MDFGFTVELSGGNSDPTTGFSPSGPGAASDDHEGKNQFVAQLESDSIAAGNIVRRL